jgi:molybdopterin converting factor small subunit
MAREIVGLKDEILEVDEALSALDILSLIAEKHGEKFREYIFDPATGKPRSYLHFMLDGKTLSSASDLSTVLDHDCEVAIIPPVGGG